MMNSHTNIFMKTYDIMKNQIEKINKLYEKACDDLENNNLDQVSNSIQELEQYDTINSKVCLSCLYIDLGAVKQDENLIINGISLIENNFDEMMKIITLSSLYFNLANGYSTYYSLTKNKLFNNENIIIKTKNLYKKALELCESLHLTVEILVNFGNFYNYFGRHIEALELYEDALKLNSTHGMALLNKGQSLIEYRNLMDHDSPILLDVYNCFKDALNDSNLTYQGKISAERSIQIFEDYNNPSLLAKKRKSKLNINPNYTDLESLSNIFCYNNKLYLNLCNFCQECENSIGDTIAIRRMTTPIKNEEIQNDLFLVLSSYLNQIKMDFISARLNLILYQYEGLDLKFVNDNVVIIDSLNNELHNIKIQLIKDSFKSFYNILDKISFFINEYYNLGIDQIQIDFKKIWYSNFKKKDLREDLNFDNHGLKALFDIHEDILYGEENKFNKIRNALTHRVLKIKLFSDDEKEVMTEEKLYNTTIELAKLVRNGIIYLMAMIDIDESKKDYLNSFPMIAKEIPNDLK